MAGNKRRTNAQKEADKARIARYILQGREQLWIAEKMNLSPSTISREVTDIRKGWRESTLMDFNEARNRELAAVDMIEAEAWRAWFASKKKEVISTLSGGEGLPARVSKTEHDRHGDDRYMKIIMWCHEHRAKLMGLIITKHEHTGENGGPIQHQASIDGLKDMFQLMAKREQDHAASPTSS